MVAGDLQPIVLGCRARCRFERRGRRRSGACFRRGRRRLVRPSALRGWL